MSQGIQTIWQTWALAAVTAILVPSLGVADDAFADLEAQHAILRTRDDGLGIRGILRFALEAAGNRWNPAAVEEAIALARSMQETGPGAADFGNFRWRLGDAGITDPNAVEFALQLTSLLRVAHHDALTPAARAMLDTIHADAVVSLTRHAVKPGYTNIFLMNTWNHLALGQSHGDAIEQEGSRRWDEWLAHVRRHGITEYSSPTYYGTDLDSLGLIARHARDPRIRREAEAARAFVWTGIAANWFAPSQRLSGPHSRDYDYLLGRGYLDEHLHEAGWRADRPRPEPAGWLPGSPRGHLRVFRDACRWDPPATLRTGIAADVPRFVVQRFNAEPWARSTNHVGATFAIGVAGECRGPEDKSLAIHLPGGDDTPNVALVFDGRGDPYGRRKEPVGHGGQSKAHHLRTFLVASQHGPRITAAWMFDPDVPAFKAAPDELAMLEAHLIMPVDAEVWSGGRRLEQDAALAADATVFLKKEGVVIGIRGLLGSRHAEAPRGLRLRHDAAHIGAKRLTALFHEGRPRGRSILALEIEGRENCDAARADAFCREFSGRRVTAALEGDRLRVEGSLPLEADFGRLERVACEPLLDEASLLVVNGREIGRLAFPSIPANTSPTD